MANNNTANQKIINQTHEGCEVEVLYQKMGDRWFAFSLIDDEVFVGSLTQEEIDAKASATTSRKREKLHRLSGNS